MIPWGDNNASTVTLLTPTLLPGDHGAQGSQRNPGPVVRRAANYEGRSDGGEEHRVQQQVPEHGRAARAAGDVADVTLLQGLYLLCSHLLRPIWAFFFLKGVTDLAFLRFCCVKATFVDLI